MLKRYITVDRLKLILSTANSRILGRNIRIENFKEPCREGYCVHIENSAIKYYVEIHDGKDEYLFNRYIKEYQNENEGI